MPFVTLTTAFPIAANGRAVHDHKRGDKVEVSKQVADGLVRDELAVHDEVEMDALPPPKKLDKLMDQLLVATGEKRDPDLRTPNGPDKIHPDNHTPPYPDQAERHGVDPKSWEANNDPKNRPARTTDPKQEPKSADKPAEPPKK